MNKNKNGRFSSTGRVNVTYLIRDSNLESLWFESQNLAELFFFANDDLTKCFQTHLFDFWFKCKWSTCITYLFNWVVFLVVNRGYQIGLWHRSPRPASRQAAGGFKRRVLRGKENQLKMYRIKAATCFFSLLGLLIFEARKADVFFQPVFISTCHAVKPEQQGGNHRKSEPFEQWSRPNSYSHALISNHVSRMQNIQIESQISFCAQVFRNHFTVAPWNMQTPCGFVIGGKAWTLATLEQSQFQPSSFSWNVWARFRDLSRPNCRNGGL